MTALKVFIVDDEENTRELLKNCICWDEMGMDIVGEASSGYESLDILENFEVDIIITDIKMPYMDGIEFSRKVLDKYPYINIIVLTAYDDFEYAKEGIKIGISDFLLKPINRNELKKALTALKAKVEDEIEYIQIKEKIIQNFQYLRGRFLNDMLYANYCREELLKKMSYYGLEGITGHIEIALIIADNDWTEASEEKKTILDFACLEIVKRYFEEYGGIHVFIDNGRRVVILNTSADNNIAISCERLRALIKNKLKCNVTIGIGNKYKGIENVKKSYLDAIDALKYMVIYGKNQVFSCNDTGMETGKNNIKPEELNEFDFYLKNAVEDKALDILNRLFEGLYGVKNIDYVRILAINIVTAFYHFITDMGMQFNDITQTEEHPYNAVMKIQTIPEMKRYLDTLLHDIIQASLCAKKNKTKKEILDVIVYIKENISDSGLSLAKLSEITFLNPSYLSRIFKQEMGITFIEYLTKMRMEAAIKFVKQTDLMAYQIAEKVGITDPNYFCKCFKKYTGMSISQYKKAQSIR